MRLRCTPPEERRVRPGSPRWRCSGCSRLRCSSRWRGRLPTIRSARAAPRLRNSPVNWRTPLPPSRRACATIPTDSRLRALSSSSCCAAVARHAATGDWRNASAPADDDSSRRCGSCSSAKPTSGDDGASPSAALCTKCYSPTSAAPSSAPALPIPSTACRTSSDAICAATTGFGLLAHGFGRVHCSCCLRAAPVAGSLWRRRQGVLAIRRCAANQGQNEAGPRPAVMRATGQRHGSPG